MRTLILFLAACSAQASPKEVLVGGACDDTCALSFVGMPAKLVSSSRIAPVKEPGEPLSIDGIVRDANEQPVAGVIVYAYHTNAKGIYPKGPTKNGTLRGWAVTGADGAYHFDTIRPAGYPQHPEPQHVHMRVIHPGKCHYTIDSLLFTDDPRLTEAMRKTQDRGHGGSGIATPVRDSTGWHVRRDITVGAKIDNFDRCR